jgi:hypothetical protein
MSRLTKDSEFIKVLEAGVSAEAPVYLRSVEMSKKHKMNRNNKAITLQQTSKRTTPIGVGIVLVAVMVVCVGLWWWKTGVKAIGRPANAAAVSKSDFEKLKGKWLRPDGGYVLEVRQIAADGKIDAAYLNPKPINVSQAAASSQAGQIKVFVELRDRLYPGSYYTLTYDAGNDQLAGVYNHLGIGQRFDVIFVRMR